MTLSIAPIDPAADEAFRAAHVGASEVAALFGMSPWLTEFELWHRKAGNIATPDFNAVVDGVPENERVYWGVKMEPVIVEAACERWGYEPLQSPHFLSNGKGLGGHPDRIVNCPERGRGVLEVKTADWLVVKGWGDEPPAHYLLQNLTYQGLAGCDWGDVIVLVGGNKLERFQYDFRPKIYADIEARVAAFWQSVRDGKAPKPDYSRDGRTLIDVIGAPTDEVIDLRNDFDAGALAGDYLAAKEAEKAAAQRADTIKAQIIEKIGTAGFALLPDHKISATQTKGSPGTLITEAMVGTTIGARKGYRRFDVKGLN